MAPMTLAATALTIRSAWQVPVRTIPVHPTVPEAVVMLILANAPATVSAHPDSAIWTPPTPASPLATKVRPPVTSPTTVSARPALNASLETAITPLPAASPLATLLGSHTPTLASALQTVSASLGTARGTPASRPASRSTPRGATRTAATATLIQNANLLTAPLMPAPPTAPRTPLWATTLKAVSALATTSVPSRSAKTANVSPAATSSSSPLEVTLTSASAPMTRNVCQPSVIKDLASPAAM